MYVYNTYMIILNWDPLTRQSDVVDIDVDVVIDYDLAPEAVISQTTTQAPKFVETWPTLFPAQTSWSISILPRSFMS